MDLNLIWICEDGGFAHHWDKGWITQACMFRGCTGRKGHTFGALSSPTTGPTDWKLGHKTIHRDPSCTQALENVGPILYPAIVRRDNPSVVISHPGTHLVQEFLLTQGVKPSVLELI